MKIIAAVGILVVSVGVAVMSVHATPPTTTQAGERPVMHVKTAAELVAAIGPRRIIELEAGEYTLSKVKREKMANARWEEALDDQYELVIHDAPELTIRCAGEKPAHVVMEWAYANVLVFEKCDGIELKNLRMGHAPDVGSCTGGVVKLSECKGVTIKNCDLYGCGIHGLNLTGVDDMKFVESTIEDCSYGIMEAKQCDGLRFEKAVFQRNVQFYGFDLKDCSNVSLVDCTIKDNVLGGLGYPLFKTNLSDETEKIKVKGGTIEGNCASDVVNTAGMVSLDGVKIADNSWQVSEEVQKLRGTKEPRKEGGWTYHVAVGETDFWGISISVYGDGRLQKLLKDANPKLDGGHIKADTVVICPPKPDPGL